MKAGRRAAASSPAPTLAELAPSRTVDVELLWFFNAEDGDFASSSNFGRLLSSVADDGEWRTPEVHARAVQRHRVIRSHLKAIPDHDAGVLQCAYAPRPWPILLTKACRRLTGIVVRLSCTRKTWPVERPDSSPRTRRTRTGSTACSAREATTAAAYSSTSNAKAEAEFAHALGAYTLARRGRPRRVP